MLDREQQSQEGWELGRDLWSQETWSCRTTSLEVFWWASQRMLLLGALHHPHSLGTHSPALGSGYFSFPCLIWKRSRWVIAGMFYCGSLCSTAKPHSIMKQEFRLQNQPTNSYFRAALLLATTIHPYLPITLSPVHKRVPQVTGNPTFLHHELAFHQ